MWSSHSLPRRIVHAHLKVNLLTTFFPESRREKVIELSSIRSRLHQLRYSDIAYMRDCKNHIISESKANHQVWALKAIWQQVGVWCYLAAMSICDKHRVWMQVYTLSSDWYFVCHSNLQMNVLQCLLYLLYTLSRDSCFNCDERVHVHSSCTSRKFMLPAVWRSVIWCRAWQRWARCIDGRRCLWRCWGRWRVSVRSGESTFSVWEIYLYLSSTGSCFM